MVSSSRVAKNFLSLPRVGSPGIATSWFGQWNPSKENCWVIRAEDEFRVVAKTTNPIMYDFIRMVSGRYWSYKSSVYVQESFSDGRQQLVMWKNHDVSGGYYISESIGEHSTIKAWLPGSDNDESPGGELIPQMIGIDEVNGAIECISAVAFYEEVLSDMITKTTAAENLRSKIKKENKYGNWFERAAALVEAVYYDCDEGRRDQIIDNWFKDALIQDFILDLRGLARSSAEADPLPWGNHPPSSCPPTHPIGAAPSNKHRKF